MEAVTAETIQDTQADEPTTPEEHQIEMLIQSGRLAVELLEPLALGDEDIEEC